MPKPATGWHVHDGILLGAATAMRCRPRRLPACITLGLRTLRPLQHSQTPRAPNFSQICAADCLRAPVRLSRAAGGQPKFSQNVEKYRRNVQTPFKHKFWTPFGHFLQKCCHCFCLATLSNAWPLQLSRGPAIAESLSKAVTFLQELSFFVGGQISDIFWSPVIGAFKNPLRHKWVEALANLDSHLDSWSLMRLGRKRTQPPLSGDPRSQSSTSSTPALLLSLYCQSHVCVESRKRFLCLSSILLFPWSEQFLRWILKGSHVFSPLEVGFFSRSPLPPSLHSESPCLTRECE